MCHCHILTACFFGRSIVSGKMINGIDAPSSTCPYTAFQFKNSNLGTFLTKHNATPYQVVLASAAVLFHKLCVTEQVCLGSVHSGRSQESQNSVGCFAQSFLLNLPVNSKQSFNDVCIFYDFFKQQYLYCVTAAAKHCLFCCVLSVAFCPGFVDCSISFKHCQKTLACSFSFNFIEF